VDRLDALIAAYLVFGLSAAVIWSLRHRSADKRLPVDATGLAVTLTVGWLVFLAAGVAVRPSFWLTALILVPLVPLGILGRAAFYNWGTAMEIRLFGHAIGKGDRTRTQRQG